MNKIGICWENHLGLWRIAKKIKSMNSSTIICWCGFFIFLIYLMRMEGFSVFIFRIVWSELLVQIRCTLMHRREINISKLSNNGIWKWILNSSIEPKPAFDHLFIHRIQAKSFVCVCICLQWKKRMSKVANKGLLIYNRVCVSVTFVK